MGFSNGSELVADRDGLEDIVIDAVLDLKNGHMYAGENSAVSVYNRPDNVIDSFKSNLDRLYSPENIGSFRSTVEKVREGRTMLLDGYSVIPADVGTYELSIDGEEEVVYIRMEDGVKGSNITGKKVIVMNNKLIDKEVDDNYGENGRYSSRIKDDSSLSTLIHEYIHGEINSMQEKDRTHLYKSLQSNPLYGNWKGKFLSKFSDDASYRKNDDVLADEMIVRSLTQHYENQMGLLTLYDSQKKLLNSVYDSVFEGRIDEN